MSEERYYPRSASDKTDDWPIWFVADRQKGGLNVTGQLVRKYLNPYCRGSTLTIKEIAVVLAKYANEKEK